MRKHFHISLNDWLIDEQELHEEAIVRSRHYLIAKILLTRGGATVAVPGEHAYFIF